MAIKITKEDFEKKFGQGMPIAPTPGTPGNISSAFKGSISQAKEGYSQAKNAKNPLQLLEGGTKLAAGAFGAAFSPLAAITEPTLGKGINYAADKISDNSSVQKFAGSKAGAVTSRVAENVGNLSTIAGTVGGIGASPKVAGAIKQRGGPVVSAATKKLEGVGNVYKDVVPSSERIVNSAVSKALDLTQNDIKNIFTSTGNEVGQFVAENNLIRSNKQMTYDAINDFYKSNYDLVRSEIGKVNKSYNALDVPRYTESLNLLKKQLSDTPGLEKNISEVDTLLKKPTPKLEDIQRAKELLDEHFNLYKATGDVKEGIAKEGLANVRRELKTFIEQEVKANAGEDIAALNNKVATAKGTVDAVKSRTTRGLTRSNLRIGDLGIFGIGATMGGPLTGLAAVFGKKLLESPAVMLRIAKYMDSISDAKKARIKSTLENGKIPEDFQQFIKQPESKKQTK